MKKLFLILLSLFLLVGCSNASTPNTDNNVDNPNEDVVESYKVLVPKGAPALGLVTDIANSTTNTYDLVDGTDVITTELARSDSEYDIIVAPVNLGSKLYMAGKSQYKLAAIITWGNLYMLGTKSFDELGNEGITAFGEVAVPGKVLTLCMELAGLENEVTFYGSATEAQTGILSNQTNYALLAEPAVTATIAKAKQNGLELSVVWDLQAVFEENYGEYGFPQAAIFVKEETYNTNPTSVDSYLAEIESNANNANSNPESIRAAIENVGAAELGVPSADMAINSYDRQNISYGLASASKEQLKVFLDLFDVTFDDSLFLK